MHFLLIVVISIISGIFAGMGMGGGTILVPMLGLFFGIEQIICQSTNIICFVVLAIFCAVIYIKNKMIDFGAFWPIVIPAVIISFVASIFTLKINSGILRILFAIFIIGIGIYYFVSSLIKMRTSKK